MGINDLQVQTVPDPRIVNPNDVILKVRLTTTCGSDLHLIDGYIPTMREGDVIGHEYMGEVVEVGRATTKLRVGDVVVVPSFIGCGRCWYCDHELWSLCDDTHPKPELAEPVLGYPPAAIPGYSHAFQRPGRLARRVHPGAVRRRQLLPGARGHRRRAGPLPLRRGPDRVDRR
jgi:threonine dehydrogenase-like Zn-dependent dehydrogenase